MEDRTQISVHSIVSNRHGRGIVQLAWGEESGQLETSEARELAMNLLAVADAAESDAFLASWCRNRLSLPDEKMAMLLMDFRSYREKLLAEQEK